MVPFCLNALCCTHTQALCLLGCAVHCYMGFRGTRQSCNAVLAAFACVTLSLTFAGCEVRPPSQHALERGTMKEAIDFY